MIGKGHGMSNTSGVTPGGCACCGGTCYGVCSCEQCEGRMQRHMDEAKARIVANPEEEKDETMNETFIEMVDRLGLGETYYKNPIVRHALDLIETSDLSVEEVLALVVKTLADANEMLQKDLVAVMVRPLSPVIIKDPLSGEPGILDKLNEEAIKKLQGVESSTLNEES